MVVWNKKQYVDQALHFGVGLVATLLIAQLVPAWVAALIVFVFAIGREIYQRLSKKDKWYSCGTGCMLDIVFWVIGIGTAVAIAVLGLGYV